MSRRPSERNGRQIEMRILHKGLILVSTMLVFELVFIGTLLWYFQQLEKNIEEQAHYARITQVVRKIDNKTREIGFDVVTAALNRDTSQADETLAALNEIGADIQSSNKLFRADPRHRQVSKELDQIWTDLQSLLRSFNKAFKKNMNITPTDQALLLTELQEKVSTSNERLNELLTEYANRAEACLAETQSSRTQLRLVMALGVILNVLFAGGALVFFNRDVSRRIEKITDNSERLANGEQLTLPDQGDDEIAKLDQVFHDVWIVLRQSAERERALFENAVDIICAIDGAGQITRVNQAFERRFGYERSTVVGNCMVDYLVEEDREGFARFLGVAMSEEILSHHTEKRMRTIDGDIQHMEWSVKWDGNEQSFFCIIHDITARKELEKAKQEFFSMVSHDLRSPLTSIRVSLGMFLAGVFGQLPEKGVTRIRAMDTSIDRLIRLINNLLDSEKLDAGKFDLSVKPVNTSHLVKAAVEAVQGMADAGEVQLKVSGDDMVVSADSDRIIQVLTNLVSNAIKFSPPKSAVEIRTLERGDFAEIRVIDKGKGIPLEKQSQLFKRFRQVDSQGEVEKKGTGLGLAISKAIVDAHDGTIGVDSEEGQGCAFWFRLHRD